MKASFIAFALGMMLTTCHAKPLASLVDWSDGSDSEESSDESDELGNAWEKSGQFEGDIIVGSDDSIRNGLVDDELHWPNKTLIYQIDSETYDDEQQAIIQAAIGEFHKKTCIHLRKRKEGDKDFVFITGKGASGCSSHVGRHGGKQELFLKPNEPGKGCLKKGTIIHELLHALGFYHQQSAPERDEYITIVWENIEEGREHNFKKYETDAVTNFNVSYDYQSIMHYSAYAFSKNDEKTIIPLEEGVRIGQRKTLSEKDITKLHQMYQCKPPKTKKTQKNDAASTSKKPSLHNHLKN